MTKYTIKSTKLFRKELKQAQKRGYKINELETVVSMLADGVTLPERYLDHALTGNYKGFRECHINPDWLLIYKIHNDILVLTLSRTGTNSDLFKK